MGGSIFINWVYSIFILMGIFIIYFVNEELSIREVRLFVLGYIVDK